MHISTLHKGLFFRFTTNFYDCISSSANHRFFQKSLPCHSIFDHHLTTTVQRHCKKPKKPVVTTNNGLFLVLEATVQNQHNLRSNASLYRPVVVLRLNTYFQLRYFIFCTTKIAVLSFVFMSCCSIFSSLLRVVFCDVELRLLSDAQLS